MLEDNPYERQTELIKKEKAVLDLNYIRRIMLLSREKKFQQICESLAQILDQPQIMPHERGQPQQQKNIFYPPALENQLKILKYLYESLLRGSEPELPSHPLSHADSIRLLHSRLTRKLRLQSHLTPQQLQSLISSTREHPQFKTELMVKLVGCKQVTRMKDISIEEIEELTPVLEKKACKYSIAAEWKYIVGMAEDALLMKSKAKDIWRIVDREGERSRREEKQYEEMGNFVKSGVAKSKYEKKLVALKFLVQELDQIEASSLQQKETNKKRLVLRHLLSVILNQMEFIQVDSKSRSKKKAKSKEAESPSKSVLKKKDILDERRLIGNHFQAEITKNNMYSADFVPPSRFITNNYLRLSKILGAIRRIHRQVNRAYYFRDFIAVFDVFSRRP